MADTKGFGCGVAPFLFKDPEFHEICEWHDNAYLENSWHSKNLSRKQTDEYFRDYMLAKASHSIVLTIKAHLYYRLARIFGKKYWEGLK